MLYCCFLNVDWLIIGVRGKFGNIRPIIVVLSKDFPYHTVKLLCDIVNVRLFHFIHVQIEVQEYLYLFSMNCWWGAILMCLIIRNIGILVYNIEFESRTDCLFCYYIWSFRSFAILPPLFNFSQNLDKANDCGIWYLKLDF